MYLLNGKKEKCRGIYIYNSKYKHGFWFFFERRSIENIQFNVLQQLLSYYFSFFQGYLLPLHQ